MTRRVQATLWRLTGPGKDAERVAMWHRQYAWLDTAMPRAIALALNEGQPGDVVEFHSLGRGVYLGTVRVLPRGRVEVDYSDLIDNNPALARLLKGV